MSLPIALGCIIAALVVGCILGGLYRKKVSEREIGSAEEKAKQIINDAYKSAESKRRETLLEAKEEIHKSRSEYEREVKERRAELQKQERRLQQKEETLDRKTDTLDKKTDALNQKIAAIDTKQNEINQLKKTQMELLEKISGYTVEEAKTFLINSLKDDVVHEQALMVKELENQYKDEADSRAREMTLEQWKPELIFEVKARRLRLLRGKAGRSEAEKNRLLPEMESLLAGLIALNPARAAVLCA